MSKPSAKVDHKDSTIELIELLFFAYRDFIAEPDEILIAHGFGRAHHRVLHFIGRNPGMKVAELLDILRITKQSLARVLRELVATNYVYQEAGTHDRRQRLLYLTQSGHQLLEKLMAPQIDRVESALKNANINSDDEYRKVLFHLIDPHNQHRVSDLISLKYAAE